MRIEEVKNAVAVVTLTVSMVTVVARPSNVKGYGKVHYIPETSAKVYGTCVYPHNLTIVQCISAMRGFTIIIIIKN